MQQWFNPSHPQTLQAGVILGYFAGFFSLLGGGGFFLLVGLGLMIGAFGTANNKKWGYIVLAVCAVIRVLLIGLVFFGIIATPALGARFLIDLLFIVNGAIFPIALAAAVLHAHSREYQKVWFE